MTVTKYDREFNAKRDKVFNLVKEEKKNAKAQSPDHKAASAATADPELTVENLNLLTSIADGKDMAQVDTEQYLNNNIIYFMDDNQRKNLLGQPDKPAMTPALLEIVNDPDVQAWYTEISVPWLALGLNGNSGFSVNGDILQADVGVLLQKTYYLNQTNLLYHYSYAQRVPDIVSYVQDTSNNWAKKYKNYLLSQVMPGWISSAPSLPAAVVSLMMKQWTTKLDILDPSGKTSQTIQQKFSLAMTNNEIYKSLDKVTKTKIFGSILLKSLQDLVQSTDSQQPINDVKSLVQQMGTPQAVATELSASFAAINYTNLMGATTVTEIGTVVAEAGATTWSDTFKNILQRMGGWQGILGGLLLTTVAATFVMGLVYWNVSDNEQKARTTVSGVSTFVLAVNSNVTKSFVQFVAKYANKLYNLVMRQVASEALIIQLEDIGAVLKGIFGTVNTFVNTVLGPILIVISIGFLVYDMVQDVKTQNWGAFSMDMIATLASLGLLVATVFASMSWSGPVAVVCAVIVGIAGLVKAIFFKPKTPLQQFYDSLPMKYKTTSLKIYALPESITANTYLTYIDSSKKLRYVVPDSSASSKLAGSTTLSSTDPFQLKRVQDTGIVILSNPFNSLSGVQASFLSTRNSKSLGPYQRSSGPAVETETFLPIDAGNDTFYLIDWYSNYVYVNSNNQLAMDSSKKQKFSFTAQVDWFGAPNTASMLGDNTLSINTYLANPNYGLAFVQSGLYIIEMPSDITNLDIQTYIKNNPTKIYYTLVSIDSKVTLSSSAVATVGTGGDVYIQDGSTTYNSNLVKNTKSGLQLSGTLALVWPTTSNDGFKVKVIDDEFCLAYSQN